MWFDTLPGPRPLPCGRVAAYLTVVVALRLSGKRILAKLNAFDFVVTGNAPGYGTRDSFRQSVPMRLRLFRCRGLG
jgi:hypothetical protein